MVNVLDYILKSSTNYNKVVGVSSSNTQMRQIRYDHINGDIDIFWVKWDQSQAFEWYRYVAADEYIYQMFDTGPADVRCGRWRWLPGKWLKKDWNVGEYFLDDLTFYWYDNDLFIEGGTPATQQYQLYPPLCSARSPLYEPHYLKLANVGSKNFGGNIGTCDYIEMMWIKQEFGIDGLGEHFWFAKNHGWVGWQDWPEGSVAQFWPYSHTATPKVYPNFNIIAPSAIAPVGPYLSAINGGQNDVIPCRVYPYAGAGSWEWFNLIKLATSKYAIQTQSGWYLSAESNGGSAVNTTWCDGNITTPKEWETFTFLRQSDGYYAIKCYDDVHYLNAPNGGESALDATATAISTNQKFGINQISGNVYVMWTKNFAAFGPEFPTMPTRSYPPT